MRLHFLFSILILCVIISAVSAQSSREINKTIPLKADGRLVIDTYKGSITITTHDKPQVEVNVKIESDDSDTWDTGRDVENTEIRIDGGEDEDEARPLGLGQEAAETEDDPPLVLSQDLDRIQDVKDDESDDDDGIRDHDALLIRLCRLLFSVLRGLR